MKKIFVLILFVFISCDGVQYGEKNEIGNSYYFNSIYGNNSNLGTKEKPFKSLDYLEKIELYDGDKILLSNGSTFLNTIELVNKNGIEISNYQGDSIDKLPTINSKGKIASVFIENSSNININNIELTANGGGANRFLHKKLKSDLRTGILYLVTDKNVHNNLEISNVLIKDIFYENQGFIRDKKEVKTPNGTQSYGWGIRILNLSKEGNLKNIIIKHSDFENISHTAIRFIGNRESKFENIKILNNRVFKSGGPGMVFNSTKNLIAVKNDINYSGSDDDSRKWGRGSGLWTWGSSFALIAQNKFQNANGPADSAGCHIDFNCNDIIVENNLSRNNAGGFIEILGNNFNCSYRYNISINDGHRVKGKNGAFQEGKTFWLSGYVGKGRERSGPFDSYIYGNHVYVGKDIVPKIAVDKKAKGVFVHDNIFYFENDPVMVLGDQYKPDNGGNTQIENVIFTENIFKRNHWPKDVLIQPTQSSYDSLLLNYLSLSASESTKSDLKQSIISDLGYSDYTWEELNKELSQPLYDLIKKSKNIEIKTIKNNDSIRNELDLFFNKSFTEIYWDNNIQTESPRHIGIYYIPQSKTILVPPVLIHFEQCSNLFNYHNPYMGYSNAMRYTPCKIQYKFQNKIKYEEWDWISEVHKYNLKISEDYLKKPYVEINPYVISPDLITIRYPSWDRY